MMNATGNEVTDFARGPRARTSAQWQSFANQLFHDFGLDWELSWGFTVRYVINPLAFGWLYLRWPAVWGFYTHNVRLDISLESTSGGAYAGWWSATPYAYIPYGICILNALSQVGMRDVAWEVKLRVWRLHNAVHCGPAATERVVLPHGSYLVGLLSQLSLDVGIFLTRETPAPIISGVSGFGALFTNLFDRPPATRSLPGTAKGKSGDEEVGSKTDRAPSAQPKHKSSAFKKAKRLLDYELNETPEDVDEEDDDDDNSEPSVKEYELHTLIAEHPAAVPDGREDQKGRLDPTHYSDQASRSRCEDGPSDPEGDGGIRDFYECSDGRQPVQSKNRMYSYGGKCAGKTRDIRSADSKRGAQLACTVRPTKQGQVCSLEPAGPQGRRPQIMLNGITEEHFDQLTGLLAEAQQTPERYTSAMQLIGAHYEVTPDEYHERLI
ncbi:hypothetical protein Ciccas_010262 [Cichlidogyrus casuarinus]|uniref:Uncharacterized protein n=1 Tax=Cichlidogyrus casuarinus TaxID=1844966 RepID=A0ABD2PUL1_9PLAT